LKQENFNIVQGSQGKSRPAGEAGLRKLRILIAPLDWGLGHATRCIPIIYELLSRDCDVWIGATGMQEALLKQEFPGLSFLPLAGYNVKYGWSAAGMLWNMFSQSRKILSAIKKENEWLKKMVDEYDFDGVISDNRYGLYHKDRPCIFITHQLTIKTPFGKWPERLLQKQNYKYINRFSGCWVPDEAGENNLAGELSHPENKPAIPLKHIGMLSRLEMLNDPAHDTVQKGHLLFILSGPEPQRTILENEIIRDIAHYPGTATVVRGLPGVLSLVPSTNAIKFYNHLPAEELNKEMNRAEYIISRSGYSTIMDLTKLQKKSILIPTPGQTEQEWLARYLLEIKIAITIPQKKFSLFSALESAKLFPYSLPKIQKENNLKQAVAQFLGSLQKH
jgi:UDP-N-acetylglucosamine transferase subunit ALG13